LNEVEEALQALAEGLDLEDLEIQREQDNDNDDNNNDGDGDDGWIDERKTLSVADREALDASVHPVKLVLVKVNS
jgi:hypothetical protein